MVGREILFRGKRDKIYGKGWTYGVPYIDYEGDCIMASDGYKYVVIPETIGQYIERNDSNNNHIFEDDIVEITLHSGTKYQYLIWFNKEMSCREAIEIEDIRFNGNDYYGNKVEYSDFCLMLQDPYGDVESVKVIGNIHDNPEILKNSISQTT